MADDNIERAFVTRMVETGDAVAVRRAGVTPDWFTDEDAREAFVQATRYHGRHGSFPSVMVLRTMTAFHPVTVSDPISGLIERMREQALYAALSVGLTSIREEALADPRAAMAKMQAESSALRMKFSDSGAVWNREDAIKAVRTRYEERKAKKGLIGIPWPWQYLNDATGGIQKSDYLVIHGRRKSYKSWILMAEAVHAYRTRGTTFLYVFKEMTETRIQDRMLALFAGVPWKEFCLGRLNDADQAKLALAEEELLDCGPYAIRRVRSMGADCLGEIQGYADEYEPELTIFDGMYLVDPGRDWKVLTAFSTSTRAWLDESGMAFIGTVQTNRDGEIGYADAFEQDCTGVIQIERDEALEAEDAVRISSPAATNFVFDPFILKTIPAIRFEFDRVDSDGGEGGADEMKPQEPSTGGGAIT